MQLGDLLCCLLLTITVTATCARGEEDRQKREVGIEKSRRILKRDAAILIDNFPIEPVHTHRPTVIYRRISRQRYGPVKPKYGPPSRTKYGPPRKPTKKYKKPVSTKYGRAPHKKRAPNPRYGPPKRPTSKPIYGPPKKTPSYFYNPEPAGFAEPPSDYESHHQPQSNYAEPPVDSYGAPLKTQLADPYPTAPSYNESPGFDNQEFSSFGQEYNWQNYQRENDNTYAYSKKRPQFIKPDDAFEPNHEDADFNPNPYADVLNYNAPVFKEPQYLQKRKKKPQFFGDTSKKVNKHWKAPRFRPDNVKQGPDDEILVGGQYAEPPPRYVPKFQPSAPMFNNEDDFSPLQGFADSDVAASATISPYVNYKHSNMAFSPQNLNDAFSIVEK